MDDLKRDLPAHPNQEVNFTDAKVSYEYEEPLGEQ